MMNSNFVWTDLSTFDIGATKQFYADVLGGNIRKRMGKPSATMVINNVLVST